MNNLKEYLFGTIMFIVCLSPIVKEVTYQIDYEFEPLGGHVQLANQPEFSIVSWLDGSFQMKFDKSVEDHIGFRSWLVRLYNQIDFSLFKRGHAGGVVIGKEDYLYETNYILAYTGKNYLGEKFIKEKCAKIKIVQDELAKLNTELLIVFAPGKASFFPEYIPDRYLKDSLSITNNDAYLSCFRDQGINYIDFNSLFINMRDTSRYELYHKCGIHWSRYGSLLALDSIIGYIEDAKGIDMVDMSIEGIEVSADLKGTDYDVAEGLNLIYEIPGKPMPYPYGHKYEDEGKIRPKLMVIADSYYWSIYTQKNSWNLWDEQDFRYYNEISFSPNQDQKDPDELSVDELGKFDVIMIMYTEANMLKFANNFFEEAFMNLMYNDRLEEIIQHFSSSPEILETMKVKAIKKGVSLEEMIRIDAYWVLNNELEKEEIETENNQ